MAKVKRMMFGGAAKAVGKAVAAKAAPMRMQNAARSAAAQAAPKPMPPQAGAAPTPQMAAAAYKKMQPVQRAGQLARSAVTTVPARGISRGDLKMAGMMKKGGAVKKKATKK